MHQEDSRFADAAKATNSAGVGQPDRAAPPERAGGSRLALALTAALAAGVLAVLGVGALLVTLAARNAAREAETARHAAERAAAQERAPREDADRDRKATLDRLLRQAERQPPQKKWKIEAWKPASEDDRLIDRFVTLHNAEDAKAADLLAPLPAKVPASRAMSERCDAGDFLRRPKVQILKIWRGEPDAQGKPRPAANRYTLVSKGGATVPSGYSLIDPVIVVEVRGKAIHPVRTALYTEP